MQQAFNQADSEGLKHISAQNYQAEFLRPLGSEWQVVAVYPPKGVDDISFAEHMAVIEEATAREKSGLVSFYHPNVAGKMS